MKLGLVQTFMIRNKSVLIKKNMYVEGPQEGNSISSKPHLEAFLFS